VDIIVAAAAAGDNSLQQPGPGPGYFRRKERPRGLISAMPWASRARVQSIGVPAAEQWIHNEADVRVLDLAVL
jgi:hypothetical protein